MVKKRGTISTLISLVIASIVLLGILTPMYGRIIKPLLTRNQIDPSLQSFNQMINIIHDIENSNKNINYQTMILHLGNTYKIVAFDPGETTVKFYTKSILEKDEISRPLVSVCDDNQGCLCLYHGDVTEEKSLIKCGDFDNTKFYSLYKKDIRSPESLGFEKKGFPDSNDKYENIIFFGYKKASMTLTEEAKDVYWGSQEIYIEKQKSGTTNNILITINNDKTKQRVKENNKCPEKSYSKCVGQHFDKIIIEIEKGVEKKYNCKYSTQKDYCEKKPIITCPDGKLWTLCACGDTAYESGFCFNQKYKANDIPVEDYCFANKIEKCEDYQTGTYKSKDMACLFNICNIDENCVPYYYFGNEDMFKECGSCPTSEDCDCDNYINEAFRELDPCNCGC